jgi:20S proteasome alpha/beta subunit
MGLDEQIQNTNPKLQIIVAGVDEEPHLHLIEAQGVQSCWDSLGFLAIGSGASLATLQWVARCSGYADSIANAVYVAHEAKLKSEAHPGVGQETDMAIITADAMIELPQACIANLREEQVESIERMPMPGHDELEEEVHRLTMESIEEEESPHAVD